MTLDKFETYIQEFPIELILTVPKSIAEIKIIDLVEYRRCRDSTTPDDKLQYLEYEKFINAFAIYGNKSRVNYKDTHKIFVMCFNWSTKITERKIIQYLKEKQNGTINLQ